MFAPEQAVLSVIGGGSAYTPGLISAIDHYRSQHNVSKILLYDTDANALEIVTALCKKITSLKVCPVKDLDEAVTGVDLVLNTTRPGGLKARHFDETVPLQFGIPGQETVGPGGFFFALRSVPLSLDLADRIAKRSPEAILLNYTNPTNIVTQALSDHSSVRVIGLCDQSDEDLIALGESMTGVTPTTYTFDCVGLNHATLYTNIYINDTPIQHIPKDLTAPESLDAEHKLRFAHATSIVKGMPGIWPNSYLPYYFYPEPYVHLARDNGVRADQIIASLQFYYDHFEAESRKEVPALQYHRGSLGFGDLAVRVMIALWSDVPHDIVLNLPNQTTDVFQKGTVIESRVRVSRNGIDPLLPPPVPDEFQDLLEAIERYQRLTTEAAISGEDRLIVEALASNPLVKDSAQAKALIRRRNDCYEDIP